MDMPFLKNNINWSAPLIFALGVLLIVFLSWKSNPNLNELEFIPDWLSNWADHDQNSQTRTAVPLIGLGIYTSVTLIYMKLIHWYNWGLAWATLTLIVCIAEGGQFLLPSRTPDIKDVFWGGLGAGIGLAVPLVLWQLIVMLKTFLNESKKV